MNNPYDIYSNDDVMEDEDFDDVVRGQDVPITAHMRDAALLLPHSGGGSAGDLQKSQTAGQSAQ